MNDEMSAVLDDLGVPDEPVINADPPKQEVIEEVIEEEEIEEEIENPPGFISHADYVEKNGNDDGWKGKDAYSAEYDRIQDNKSLRGEIKNLTSLVQTTVDATTSLQEERYQQGLAEARAELKEAIDNNDATAAVEAQNKINRTPPPQAAPKANPLHAQFFESNPMLDKGSTQFDGEMMAEFSRIYDGRLRADGVQLSDQLSERAIQGYMKSALDSAKSLFPDKFESPRNTRNTGGKNQKRNTNKVEAVDNIKNVKITTKNPRDNNAMMDTYNTILNMKGGGKEEADKFAKAMGIPQ